MAFVTHIQSAASYIVMTLTEAFAYTIILVYICLYLVDGNIHAKRYISV